MKVNTTRRNILKAGAALSIVPWLPIGCASPNIMKNGKVLTVSHWGVLNAEIKDGKAISSAPVSKTSSIANPMQNTIPELITSTRIKTPMVRKSYLANPDAPKPELRGIDEWVEIKYEDAIKLVAKELKKTRAAKGSTSVYAGSYGWKSIGNVHNAVTLLQRFMNLSGGYTGGLGDYSTGASQIIMPHVTGNTEVYEQQSTWPVILENSKVVVLWGMNPHTTLKISWIGNDEMGLHYLEKLKDSGKQIYIIDPIKSETVKFFGDKAKHIAPIPQSDVALMLGMAYHLYSTKNYDKNFLDTYCVGFDKFLNYLTGKSDGVAKTPAWASNKCGISQNVIKNLAITCYKNRSMLMSGWGMQRQHHGDQPHWMLVTLASMIGQIGLEGGGFGLSYHYGSGGVPTSVGGVIGGMNLASLGRVEGDKFLGTANTKTDVDAGQSWLASAATSAIPVARIADCILNPGKVIDHNGSKITYPEIDFIYWCGGNPLVHHQDTNTTIKAWRKPRTIVVNEIYWTPTAKMADIVFPVTTQYERNDITMVGDYSNMAIAPIKQLVEPMYEAKSDYQVFTDLSKAYASGLAEAYTDGGKSEMDWIKEFYSAAAKSVNSNPALVESLGAKMPDFSAWWEKNEPTKFAPSIDSEQYVKFKAFREDPILNALGTPSGLIEIYSSTIEKMKYNDCGAHARWYEPIEWLGNSNKNARFQLLSTHPADRLHSQQNNVASLRKTYAVKDREPILINTKDARALGIKNGDLVRVYNKRGEILAGAIVSDDILPRVVRVFEGAWYDGFDSKICKNGSANVLTIDMPTSKLSNGNISHSALVNIEKYKGETLALSAFSAPKGAK